MAGQVFGWAARVGTAVAAALSSAAAFGRVAPPQAAPLPDAVSGERHVVRGRSGPLSYYVTGSGAPILLIHSVNAAASAYEVQPFVEELRRERRVYAVDLPGFGFSDRSDRRYDVRLYVDAIHDMLDAIADEVGPGPVDALALSLSAEFLARAATERPGGFRTLAFVTPTGFERGSETRRAPPGATREVRGLYRGLTVPLWSRGLYSLLVRRGSIRYFLQRTFGSKRIPEGMLDYAYATAHQPGARHAPYAFVSGRLFSADTRTLYEGLTAPTIVLHGTKGDFQDFSEAGWAMARPNWRFHPFPTGALPQFEQLPAVMAAYRPFLATPPDQSWSSSPSRSPSP